MAYFPMFVDLNQKPCLIVGGGTVACRKALTLLDFGAYVRVIAPVICGELLALSDQIDLAVREFADGDCRGNMLVIAATDDPVKNHEIAKACKAAGIPVNAVDQKEDCTFLFPSYLREGDVVAAFSSAGKSPVLTQYLKEEEKKILTEALGRLNDYLGGCRRQVQERFATEEARRRAFRRILAHGLKEKTLPDDAALHELLASVDRETEEGAFCGSEGGQRNRTPEEAKNR